MVAIGNELESILAVERVKFEQLPDFPCAASVLSQCSKELVQELQHTEYSYSRIFPGGLDLNGQLQALQDSLGSVLMREPNAERRSLETFLHKKNMTYWKEQLKKYHPWVLPQGLIMEYVRQRLQCSQVCQIVKEKNERCLLKFTTFVQKQGLKWYAFSTKKKALSARKETRRTSGWDKFFTAIRCATPSTYDRLHQVPKCPLEMFTPISQRWRTFVYAKRTRKSSVFEEFTRPVSEMCDVTAADVEKALQMPEARSPQKQMRSSSQLADDFMKLYAQSVDNDPAQELNANDKDIFYTDKQVEHRLKRARTSFWGQQSPEVERVETNAQVRTPEAMRKKLREAVEAFLPTIAETPEAARVEQEERFFKIADLVYESKVASFQHQLEGRVAEAMKLAKTWFETTMLEDEELVQALDLSRRKHLDEKQNIARHIKKLETALAVVRGRDAQEYVKARERAKKQIGGLSSPEPLSALSSSTVSPAPTRADGVFLGGLGADEGSRRKHVEALQQATSAPVNGKTVAVSMASSDPQQSYNPASVEQLTAMGFSADQARQALITTGGNIEASADRLLSCV